MKITIPGYFTRKEFEYKINEVGTDNITELHISYCVNIHKIPYLPNLKILYCNNSSISSIPFMEKLEKLYCYDCSKLIEIPYFPNLKFLNCFSINIKSIPFMEKLELLCCIECPNLHEIPSFPKLKQLWCDDNIKFKFCVKNLHVDDEDNTFQHLQGRLYQNTYRTYELLIF